MAMALAVVVVGVGGTVVRQLWQPTETVLVPEADAYVSTAHPEASYGTRPTLRVDATPKIHSYLRFRLAGLSGRVVRAELRLWSRTGDLAGYSVHPVTASSWVEHDITARSGPAAGPPVASSGPFGPDTWSSVDVARFIEKHDEISLVVKARSDQNITFDSREGVHQPQLVVQTKPAPSAGRIRSGCCLIW
jgi:hypothetical protein